MTEWRPIPGWHGLYQISSDGRVRSLPRRVFRANGRSQWVDGRVLRAVPNNCGGRVVTLSRPPRPGVRHRRTAVVTTLMREAGWRAT